jgi:TonB family protein
MPPTTKEFNAVTPTSDKVAERPGSPNAHPDDIAGRPQPVALEVPVTVNGARTVEGSDKREPFSESTKTVLVFGNGTVIRLASTVAPGQLLFLTNDKTKKEVVCQVVKSKNYRNVSGYVELEFTEAISGFWGMRFPGERAPAQSSAPAPKTPSLGAGSAPRPLESKPAPMPAITTKHVEPGLPQVRADAAVTPKKEVSVPPTVAAKTETHAPSSLNLPRASDSQTIHALPKTAAPTDPQGIAAKNPPCPPDAKPAAPTVLQPPALHTSAEALKLESARLQEQLSSLLWAAPPAAKAAQSAPAAPVVSKSAMLDAAAKVLEISKKDPARPQAVPPAKTSPLKMEPALDVEEVKIPSWLEPLARNAAIPAPQEVPAKSETPPDHKAEQFELQEVATAPAAQEIETSTSEESIFGDALVSDNTIESEKTSRASNKGILISAIAAGLLLVVAGGAWYSRRPSSPTPGTATVAVTQVPATTSAPQSLPQNNAASPTTQRGSVAGSLPPVATQAQANAQSAAPTPQPISVKSATNNNSELLAYKQLAEPAPKKPILGQVRLATPTFNRSARTPDAGDAGAAPLIDGQASPNAEALGGGLAAGNTKQPAAPAAPLPVGGDVKPARMLNSISPVYPALAKSQHVEGDVRVDALIDANGHVSAMKVFSGPALLQQSAMDALRQWKYQPATLDGKPVPMHLTVTIQFRIQ